MDQQYSVAPVRSRFPHLSRLPRAVAVAMTISTMSLPGVRETRDCTASIDITCIIPLSCMGEGTPPIFIEQYAAVQYKWCLIASNCFAREHEIPAYGSCR